MPQTATAEKKKRERRIIEAARRHSGFFPRGELVMKDEPDGRIPSASLGIEVSELLPGKADGALFSGPQLAVFQEDVIETAARCYRALPDARPADVLVYFKNDWRRKQDSAAMGRALADFVHSNYPSDTDTVVLQELDRDIRGWVDGLSVVRITREDGRWQTGGCSDISIVTYDQLARRIEAKNHRVPEYRRSLPGWRIWLLFATRFPVLWSVAIPREIRSWQFKSDFDRVLLSSWEDGVLELQCSHVRAEQ